MSEVKMGECWACGGRGYWYEYVDGVAVAEMGCPACDGTGKVPLPIGAILMPWEVENG